MANIAVLGGGRIAEALISGLIEAGADPRKIRVTNRSAERGKELRETYGVMDLRDNTQAVDGADFAFICVKPDAVVSVLNEVSDTLEDNDHATTVVSMAAGVSLSTLEDTLSAGTPIVRVMPNTPMLLGAGMSAIAPGRFAQEEQIEAVKELLETVGEVMVIKESKMDAVTALSGSAPAYFFLMAEALTDAGVALGLDRESAAMLSAASIHGAGVMLRESGDSAVELRANVSSPAGTTVAAIQAFEECGIRSAFYQATQACARRAADLGKENAE